LAIFAAQLLNDKPPLIFEDGRQQRDFVNVHDVAEACRLAMESIASDCVVNVGSGERFTVLEIADRMARALNREHIEPRITQQYRIGDIRHCFADISLAGQALGYEPGISFEQGLAELASWLEGQI